MGHHRLVPRAEPLGFSPQICAAASLILGSEMNLKGFTSWASHLFRLAHFFLAQLPAEAVERWQVQRALSAG
jgi:hypothetical protein